MPTIKDNHLSVSYTNIPTLVTNNNKVLLNDEYMNFCSNIDNQNSAQGENEHVENGLSMLDIKSAVTLKKKHIHNPYITYLNINSLRNKIHDIRSMISEMSPEVLTISETKLDASFPDAQFTIEGYQNPGNLRRDRNQHGGGLITYIKKGIHYNEYLK